MDQLQYLDKSGHIQTDTLLTWGLATCHNVSQSDLGLVGYEVEVKMFAITGWNLQQMSGQPTRVAHPVDARQQLTVVRVNEFEHSRRSMSVVALDESSGELHVFCKVEGFCSWHALHIVQLSETLAQSILLDAFLLAHVCGLVWACGSEQDLAHQYALISL